MSYQCSADSYQCSDNTCATGNDSCAIGNDPCNIGLCHKGDCPPNYTCYDGHCIADRCATLGIYQGTDRLCIKGNGYISECDRGCYLATLNISDNLIVNPEGKVINSIGKSISGAPIGPKEMVYIGHGGAVCTANDILKATSNMNTLNEMDSWGNAITAVIFGGSKTQFACAAENISGKCVRQNEDHICYSYANRNNGKTFHFMTPESRAKSNAMLKTMRERGLI